MFIKNKKPEYAWRNQYGNPKYELVPCGKCANCLATRASAWSFRLMQEEKVSTSAHFLTLTYGTENLPITKNGYGTIIKRDLQLFFKRLRKSHKTNTIKYYAVGEYGGKFKRPHYHIILFNAKLSEIQTSWSKGHIHYGTVTGASVGYTLKYISKPYKNFRINDDREKSFSLMSKGLGASYLNAKSKAWHHADLQNRMYVNTGDGKKCTMPRYYKDKLYSEKDRLSIKEAAKSKFVEDILSDIFFYSREELDVRQRDKRESKQSKQDKHNLEIQKMY